MCDLLDNIVFYSHVNKRTQYEKPFNSFVQRSTGDKMHSAAFSSSSRDITDKPVNGVSPRRHSALYSNNSSPTQFRKSVIGFTRDPSQLYGDLITTRIVKGPKGLGFTLIGNDGSSMNDEFLQIKSVINGGPAHRDGVLQTGDVLVYVNSECVLGATQAHACRIFQTIGIGELVTLQVCRGYPLLFDPSNKIVTENAYVTKPNDEKEIIIKKGSDGFGFTIFENMLGQRIKKIIYPERCENLLEGDILLEMRSTYPHGTPANPVGEEHVVNFRTLRHHEVVAVLRDCPVGFWAKLLVRRNSPKHRSRTPTAAFRYGEHRPTPVPSLLPRSKTPAPHPPRPMKSYSQPFSAPSAFCQEQQQSANAGFGGPFSARNTIPRQHEKKISEDLYENFSNLRPSSTSLGFSTPNYVPINSIPHSGAEFITVNLIRKPNGFGFRVVGGTEEGTAITVGQIVPGGAAAVDDRLRHGDEIIEIDGRVVVGESHATAVQLMQKCAANGHVKLVVRRPKNSDLSRSISVPMNPIIDGSAVYDVVLNRKEGEGFGFVIISSVNNNGSTVGKIIDHSPAAFSGQLRVGDRVVAVNGINIVKLPHNDVVNLIKQSGFTVRLTVVPSTSTFPTLATHFSTSNIGSNYRCAAQPSYQHNYSYEGPQYRYQGHNGYSSGISPIPPDLEQSVISVDLERGPKGFGFSIRGGQEFDAMPLFVLRIAEDGPAALDARLKVGDQLIEINGRSTRGMTHANAIQIIKQYPTVRLLVRRSQGF